MLSFNQAKVLRQKFTVFLFFHIACCLMLVMILKVSRENLHGKAYLKEHHEIGKLSSVHVIPQFQAMSTFSRYIYIYSFIN